MVSLRSNLQRYRELNQWMHAVQKSVLWALVRIPPRLVETEKMGWLFQKFRNPERPAYIHEKGRISSEWLEQLASDYGAGGTSGRNI